MRKQINVRLPEHARKQLDDLVKQTGMTVTQLMIVAISDYHTRQTSSKKK